MKSTKHTLEQPSVNSTMPTRVNSKNLPSRHMEDAFEFPHHSQSKLSNYELMSMNSYTLRRSKIKKVPLKFQGLNDEKQKKIKAFEAFQDRVNDSKLSRAISPGLSSKYNSPSASPNEIGQVSLEEGIEKKW